MRSLFIFCTFVSCILLSTSAFAAGCDGCPNADKCVTAPVIAVGPVRTAVSCILPLRRVVVAETAPLTDAEVTCTKTVVRHRWVNKPGHRGPKRFVQRVRLWRPFARLRGCCR